MIPADEVYSDDDPAEGDEGNAAAAAAEDVAAAEARVAAEQAAAERPVEAEAEAEALHGLPWRFVITREARQAWASLPDWARRLVLARLRVIGSGTWVGTGLSKLIRMDDRGMQGLELWRLRIHKGGRVLFEVRQPLPR